MAIARQLDDPLTLATVLNRFGVSFAVPHTLAERGETNTEATTIAEQLGDLTLRFWAACSSVQYAMAAGKRDALDAGLERLTLVAEESGRPSFRWVAGNLTCTVLSVAGRHTEMEERATANLDLGMEAGEPDAFDYYAAALLAARWFQGRGMEVYDQLCEAAERDVEVPAYPAAAATYLIEVGRNDDALELMTGPASVDFQFRINNVWSSALGAWGINVAWLGRADLASSVRDQLAPFAGQLVCNRGFAAWTVSGVLGQLETVLGNFDEAEAHFVAAEPFVSALGSPYPAAMDDLGRARMHVERGDSGDAERAVFYATRAVEVAEAHDFAMIEKHSRELLTAVAAS